MRVAKYEKISLVHDDDSDGGGEDVRCEVFEGYIWKQINAPDGETFFIIRWFAEAEWRESEGKDYREVSNRKT